MIITNQGRNVNDLYFSAMGMFIAHSEEWLCDSRNGPVIRAPYPTISAYEKPKERVLFSETRDANPFFHFMESLWMLGGRNDVAFVKNYVKRMETFSDDGKTLHGAYGHRWRRHFEFDQVKTAIDMLKADNTTRRVVISMFDPSHDLDSDTKDVPCNTHIYFSPRGERLDMTVCCRSNDMIWGAYGANAVHFSMLMEFVASFAGYEVGTMYQLSNDFHVYVDEFRKKADVPVDFNVYSLKMIDPYSIIDESWEVWNEDLDIFLDNGPITGFRSKFFRRVVTPIHYAHAAYRDNDLDLAIEIMGQCFAEDWKLACIEWLNRRKNK